MLRHLLRSAGSISRSSASTFRSLSTNSSISPSPASPLVDWSKFYESTSTPEALDAVLKKRRRFFPTLGGDSALVSNVNLARDSSMKLKTSVSALSFSPGEESAAARAQTLLSVARTEFKRADMWSSGGAQKLPISDVANLVDSINRRLSDSGKIDTKDVQQHLSRSAKEKEVAHISLNQFLEAISAISAPAPPASAAAAAVAATASAHLALLPGQVSDELMSKCLAVHGRDKLLQILRAMVVPDSLLREALVPLQSPAAINYAKLVLISAGIIHASPAEPEARAAMQAAGMFAAADQFLKAAVASGYNEDLSMPAGLESPGLAMQLLPCEALALMDKIDLGDDVLEKMGVDKNDDLTVTGVKFMMVDTGMDEDTVRLITDGGVGGMVEDDINQMFPSNKVWDEQTRSWIFRPPATATVEKVAVNPSRSFFVPGRYRPIDLSAQRPTFTKTFRAKKHALINSRNTSAVPRVIDVELLSLFIDPFGKIRSRRYTRATALRQRKLAKAVKGARLAGFLPFTTGPGLLGVTENMSKGDEESGASGKRADRKFGAK